MKSTRLLCYILCLCTLLSFLPVNAVSVGQAGFRSRLGFALSDDEAVRAIVVYEGDAGIDMERQGKAKNAVEGGKTVTDRQRALTRRITEEYGANLAYSYSVLLNGVAVDTSYGTLKEIEKLDGVKGVYLANSFKAPEIEASPDAVTVGDISSLGTDYISGNGAGAVIAILDTSFYLKHEAFGQTANVKETLTAQRLQNIKDSENGLNGNGEYISAKVPYAYDYADGDLNVSNGTSHGTAVASIAVGDNGKDFHGAARNAQLLAMKVFSDRSGNTDSSIYFNALEDAYTLGADVINLSFGAQNGFTYDAELEDAVFGNVYEKLKEAGVFVICAAGNEYSQGYADYAYNRYSVNNNADGVTADYADYGVVGSPSTYGDNLSVAAAENTKHYSYGIKVGNTAVEYFDNASSLYEHFYSKLAGRSLEYVIVPGNGSASDYNGINVKGKIAVVVRGGISDTAKLQAAADNGAIGLICHNNRDGIYYLNYSDYIIPSATVSKSSFDVLRNASIKTLTVSMGVLPVENYLAGTMCDFSSWGVSPDMKLKPNVTGIGGGVLCAGSISTTDYTLMSGTSMATPTVSGFFASALMALPLDASVTRAQRYKLAYSLVFSTAVPVEYEDGVPYSPRKQGVGLPTFTGLDSTVALVSPIVNLGDDEGKQGVYTVKGKLVGLYPDVDGINVSFDGADVLSDSFVYDEDLDKAYNTLTPHRLSATVKADKSGYTVGKSGAEFTVTVSLSEEDRQYLSVAENGAFVEGYLYFTYQNGSESERIKLTFLAFYGDWEKAPVFEKYDWGDMIDVIYMLLNTTDPSTGKTYAELGYTVYDFIDANVGFNEAYLTDKNGEDIAFLGDNLYHNVPYNADRLSISIASAECKNMAQKFTIYPSMLRNVAHIIMTVSNADTGEVYYVDDTPYGMKNFFSTTTGEFEKGTYFQWDGTYTDDSGNTVYVPNGTRAKVTFETQLASEGAPLVTEREYYVYVDYEAPQIEYSWDSAAKRLTVSATDNRYISDLFVFVGDYEDYLVKDPVTASVPDKAYSVTYDLSDYDFGTNTKFYLEAQDYATNYDTISIPVNEDSTNIKITLGDVNGDEAVDNLDALLVLMYDAGITELDEKQLTVGDVNGDGFVDNIDALFILKYDAGIIDEL